MVKNYDICRHAWIYLKLFMNDEFYMYIAAIFVHILSQMAIYMRTDISNPCILSMSPIQYIIPHPLGCMAMEEVFGLLGFTELGE